MVVDEEPECQYYCAKMPQCCAFGCTMRSGTNLLSEVKFYRFPRNPTRRLAWALAVKRENFTPTDGTRICSKHFVSGAPSKEATHPDWVPSIFPHRVRASPACRERALQRYKRVAARSQNAESNMAENQGEHSDPQEGMECSGEGPLLTDDSYSTASSTELSGSDIDNLIAENKRLKAECAAFKAEMLNRNAVVDFEDDHAVSFLTGLTTSTFLLLLHFVTACYKPPFSSVIPYNQQLLMVLMKIRLGLLNKDLALRFQTSVCTVSKICHSWIDILSKELAPLIMWPARSDIRRRLPKECRVPLFNNLRCIIDCSEVFIERPCNFRARSQTFSSYKHHNTIKFLIGICPSGGISFISKFWGGRTSDLELTTKCGFLDKVQEGDLIMADRGFNISEHLALRGARLIIPASTRGKAQLSRRDVEISRRISRVRIQVERTINQLKNFRILHNIVPVSFIKRKTDTKMATMDKVLVICAALVNMRKTIFGREASTADNAS
ncbi:uncharacterized protein LOC135397970 [Ornithodoros turicata]|uniref:uncharacterized protein LOC135397970 n=1 Tax=Ornithodoros turicata TaxID=34597 RepID=UPI003138DB4F